MPHRARPASRHPVGRGVAIRQNPQRRDQLLLEKRPPPSVIGQRGQGRDHGHRSPPRPILALQAPRPPSPPAARRHIARRSRPELPPLRQRGAPRRHPRIGRRDGQIILGRAGKLRLVAVPLDHAGQIARAAERCGNRRLGMPAASARGRNAATQASQAGFGTAGNCASATRDAGAPPPPHPASVKAANPKANSRRVARIARSACLVIFPQPIQPAPPRQAIAPRLHAALPCASLSQGRAGDQGAGSGDTSARLDRSRAARPRPRARHACLCSPAALRPPDGRSDGDACRYPTHLPGQPYPPDPRPAPHIRAHSDRMVVLWLDPDRPRRLCPASKRPVQRRIRSARILR